MTLSGDIRASSTSSSAGGLAQQQYQKVLELEQQLLTTIQAKGPFDPNVRILRSNIRELFETIILEDHEFADLHDVEQSLWRLHHTRIEEFRARIRKSVPPSGSASTPASGNKPTVRREPVQKILAVFRSYLAEATGFYHDLMLKIGAKHGLSLDDLTYNALLDKNVKKDDKRTAELKRCQLSCHRCLIYLGDLARYKEYYTDGDGKSHDWSIAAGFYVKAASLWPASGNPYNQLAVLATYIGDEMLAVYHYFRSLASETPFLTAKDNLVLLFDKNLQSYSRLFQSPAGNSSQTAKLERVGRGKIRGEKEGSQGIGDESSAAKHSESQSPEQRASTTDLMKNFRVRIVRLNGILFTRTSLEMFSDVHTSVLSDLEELLKIKETDDEAVTSPSSLTSGRIWGTGPNVLLQLISILIFSVHNISVGSGPDSSQPTYAQILQRSVLLAHAFIATFECVGYILQHCAKLDDPSNSLLLPAILVILEWLSCRPEITVGSEIKEKEAAARLFFWRNCVSLLNKFTIQDSGFVTADEVKDRVVLWEDFELWGFTPLLPIQHELDYRRKPDGGLGSLRERHARVKRLKHAGKVISDMFDGTDKGMHYDVEQDVFYMMGEKVVLERKQVDVVSSADTLEVAVRTVRDSKNKPMVAPESMPTKAALTFEEEDEEVIVFKPSTKLKELSKPASLGEVLITSIQDKVDTVSDTLLSTARLDPLMGSTSAPRTELVPHSMVMSPMVPSVSSSSIWSSSSCQNLQSDTAGFTAEASGSLKRPSPYQAAKSAGLDLNSDHSPHFQGPSLDGLGLLDKNFKTPGSLFESDRLSGSTVDWGSGAGFGMQSSRNFIPATSNWHGQDGNGISSLWSSELHNLTSARGSAGAQPGLNLATVKGFPFTDSSPGSFQSAAQNLPLLNMPHVLDAVVQTKPSLQEPPNMIADNNLASLQATVQDLIISGVKLKPDTGIPSSFDKPIRRVPPSNMRPPPGFGPLPSKPPLPLSASSAFQASQPPIYGYPTVNASLQQKSLPDQSATFSVDDNVDDYAWLDGYTPPTKDTSLSSVSGLGRVTGSSTHGWSMGLNPALEATVSPFPGMKTLDRFSSPPPLSAPLQQPPLSQALLQQELLRLQQTQEQSQQQFLQEQRWQLYNAQLSAQRTQFQQVEHQQPQPSLQPPPLALQQQMPQSLWPGQNSFVS